MNTTQSECIVLRTWYKHLGCNSLFSEQALEKVVSKVESLKLCFDRAEVNPEVIKAYVMSCNTSLVKVIHTNRTEEEMQEVTTSLTKEQIEELMKL